MKYILLTCCMLACALGQALVVPFSMEPLRSPENRIGDMRRIAPADSQSLELKTDCWVRHDGKNIYFEWEMEIDELFEPGAYATRDDNQASDFVRVQIKTMANEDLAYYFTLYPRGTCFDAVRKENLQVDKAWNSHFWGRSEYSDTHWSCLMVIPFRDLRFEGQPPYRWTYSIARQVQGTLSSYSDPYTPVSGRTPRQYYDSLAPLEIREVIEKPRNYDVIPYFYRSYDMLTRQTSFDPNNLGLNLIYRPNTNSSLKLSFNPDFTEVPVDEERDLHNSKYPPQLPENRIFFTEDINAFGVTDGQFYSRNIMQPQYAVKFTSVGRGWNLGFMSAKDRRVTSNGMVTNRDDEYNILAFRPYLGRLKLQTALLARTNIEDEDYNLLMFGAPGWTISPAWQINARLAGTWDKHAGIDARKGYLAALGSDQQIGDLFNSISIGSISEDYCPGMGSNASRYLVDLHYGSLVNSFYKEFDRSFFRSLRAYLNGNLYTERDSGLRQMSSDLMGGMTLDTEIKANVDINLSTGSERMVNGKLLDWSGYSGNLSVYRWRACNFYFGGSVNNSVVFGLTDPRRSYPSYDVFAGINGFLGPVISYIFRANHTRWDALPDASAFVYGYRDDDSYEFVNLDMELTFSNDLKLVSGLRYNNYETPTQKEHLGWFCTMHWALNPDTKLYVGYKSSQNDFNAGLQKTAENAWLKISRAF